MTIGRSANRFRLAVVIAIGTVITLGSFWVLEVMRRGMTDALPDSPRSEPDFYVEKFNFIRMAESGTAQYAISGQRLIHHPSDDSYEVELPVVNSLSADRPPMTMRAKRARIEDDHSKVHLYDDVHVDRAATPTTQHFTLKSQYLLILPDDDVMTSDKRVDMTLGTSKLRGTGLFANNATRELRLSSDVHATYQPVSSRVSQ
jgi:lipopolysaccharide export system protein LptC